MTSPLTKRLAKTIALEWQAGTHPEVIAAMVERMVREEVAGRSLLRLSPTEVPLNAPREPC